MNLRALSTFFACLCVILATTFDADARPKRLAQALDSLDSELESALTYTKIRRQRIDSLEIIANKSRNSDAYAGDLLRIGNEFNGVNSDSAIYYFHNSYHEAKRQGDIHLGRMAMINYAEQMAKSAMFAEAISVLDTISVSTLDVEGRIQYYSTISQIHINASNFLTIPEIKQYHAQLALEALDSMATYFPQHSVARRLTDAQSYFMKGKATMALGELNEVFDTLPSSHAWFAIVTNMLATYYKDYPEKRDEYIYYLTLSAIADIRSANGEAASLATLGSEMFKDGDIERAFKYLTSSEEALSKSGSRVLVSQMTPPLSDLAEAMRHSQMQTNRQFIFIMALLLLALTIFVIAQVHSRERIKHKDAANIRLNESVISRDVYISRLLDLCAVYVEGLEDYNRLVSRKLKAGQAQDLYKLAESGTVIREQSEKFYEVFDQAVLNIYPNFVADVNAILAPDKQIPSTPAGKLIPELRIVAFMRLGVTDSNRISKFLSLSLNTVYTYRNRMKSRALDRDNFEAQIMKIGNNA